MHDNVESMEDVSENAIMNKHALLSAVQNNRRSNSSLSLGKGPLAMTFGRGEKPNFSAVNDNNSHTAFMEQIMRQSSNAANNNNKVASDQRNAMY